jgi:hypothetical protein
MECELGIKPWGFLERGYHKQLFIPPLDTPGKQKGCPVSCIAIHNNITIQFSLPATTTLVLVAFALEQERRLPFPCQLQILFYDTAGNMLTRFLNLG